MKQKKYTYMERLGALLYSANRMNTYMGRVTERIGIVWMCCGIWSTEHRKQDNKPEKAIRLSPGLLFACEM